MALIWLLTGWHRLRRCDYHGRFRLCVYFLGCFSAQVVPRPDQEHRRTQIVFRGERALKSDIWSIVVEVHP